MATLRTKPRCLPTAILRRRRHWSGASIGLAIAAAALYVLFVLGYPRIFPAVEQAHPANYKDNVAAAMASGDVKKAVKIVRQAAEVFPNDPAAFTLWGELLLHENDTDTAVTQFHRAVSITRTPAPEYRLTDRPNYYAPARLALGKLAADAGRPWDALGEFELARPYADLTSPEFKSYQGLLFSAYAQSCQWSRALEFADMSATDLSSFREDDLLALCTVAEGRQQWETLLRIAAELAARNPDAPACAYLAGRARFSSGEYKQAATDLEKAISHGHPDAPFFLGLTLEKMGKGAAALQPFLQTGMESLFRPFALARALMAQGDLPGEQRKLLFDELDREMARPREIQAPSVYDTHQRFHLIAVDWQEPRPGAGGPSPIVCLWQERQTAVSMPPMELLVQVENSGACALKRNDLILQLQWPINTLPFFGFEQAPVGDVELPGLRKTAPLWPDKPGSRSMSVVVEKGDNHVLRISNDNAEACAMLTSVPVPVRHPGVGFVLAARATASDATAHLTCSVLDDAERSAFDASMKLPAGSDWTWLAAYLRAPRIWHVMTVELGIYGEAGTVAYDDLMLLEIKEPVLLAQ